MDQTGWAWCQRCQGLYFTGNATQGSCPAGGEHDGSASGHYLLAQAADPSEHPHGQPQWSWCTKCQGLAYGPGFGSSRCPAGGTHDGAGSGNYTVDFAADDSPADAQPGWSWCHACQGLFFGGGGSGGVCPAGGPHDNAGSGAYTMTQHNELSTPVQLSTTQAPLIFTAPTVLGRLLRAEPVFAPDQETAITQDANAVITDHGGTRWCALATWVGASVNTATPTWQCRSTQLTITVPAVVSDAQVLPFSPGSPTASLALADATALPLSPVLDSTGLRLVASFGTDAAGRAAYDAAIGALSDPAGAKVTLGNSHTITVQVDAPAQPTPLPDDGTVIVHGPIRHGPIFTQVSARDRMSGIRMRQAQFAGARFTNLQAEEPSTAALSAQNLQLASNLQVSDQPKLASRVDMTRMIRVDRPDWNRVFIPTDPAPGSPTSHSATVVQDNTVPLAWKAQADAGAFPDIPRQAAGGWLQVTPSGSTTSLHCLPGGRPELFYYLPTEYRLGFHAGSADTDVPATPFRVTMSRGSDGDTIITVTMTAMPYLSDDDRAQLRDFLLQHELKGTEPYVELAAASGLNATFQADFLSAGSPVAMSSIQYSLDGAASSDLLQLKFTMNQLDYGLLVPMLEKGITGTVVLADDHLSVGVPVRLYLDKVITNALTVDIAPTPDPPPDPYSGAVTITNRLAYPVDLDRLDVGLVYTGQQSDIVFDAEQLPVLTAALQVPANAASAALPYTPTLSTWTHTAVVPGVVSVHGPAPAEWIATVNRDPSLQPSKVSVTLSPSVPAAQVADVRSVTVAVFAAGASTPRQPPLDIAPGHDAPVELSLSLTDIAAGLDLRSGFFLEFTSRFADDTRSLPQRIALDLTRRTVDLIVLWEPPGASYYVDADTSIGPVTREVAGQVIDSMRTSGKSWAVRAVAPAAPTPTPPG